MKMLDLVSVGDIAVDYISTVNEFPNINSNSEVLDFTQAFGGSAANTAIMCAQLGAKTGLFACIGHDFPSDYTEELKELNLHTNLFRSPLNTTTAMLYSNGEEQLTFFYRGASQELCEVEPPDAILDARVIHMCRDFTSTFKKIIQRSDAQISFNPGYGLDEIERNELEYILRHTKLLFINEHEQRYIMRTFDLKRGDIRELGPDIVVLTLGSKGCKIFSDEGEQEVGAVPTTLVDPTGAGDSFAAGFLVGYSKGYPLEKCARTGAAVASVTISTRGTHPEVGWEQIEGLISRTERNKI
jgi:ribokinase